MCGVFGYTNPIQKRHEDSLLPLLFFASQRKARAEIISSLKRTSVVITTMPGKDRSTRLLTAVVTVV